MIIKIEKGYINQNSNLVQKDILIKDGIISEISDTIYGYNQNVIDARGKLVFPGIIDVHVHLREPGFTDKETILTGTRSAVKGGVTTVMAMPNLNPVPDTSKKILDMMDIIKKDALTNVYPYASLTMGQKGGELVDITALSKLVRGFSDDGLGVESLDILKKGIRLAKDNNTIIASHAEAEGYGDSPDAEIIAVKRECEIVEQEGGSYHFCHLSLARSFELVKEAQEKGLDITCEVTPHHLFLSERDIKGTNYKMNPPLRSYEDMLASREALLEGVCSMVATDHAPHTEEEKRKEYKAAPNGIIGLETIFPLLYTHLIKTGKASLEELEKWLVSNPAQRFGIPYSKIEVGEVADIAIFDIQNKHIYKKEEILSKGKNSPFIGAELYGFNTATLVGGKVVYKRS